MLGLSIASFPFRSQWNRFFHINCRSLDNDIFICCIRTQNVCVNEF